MSAGGRPRAGGVATGTSVLFHGTGRLERATGAATFVVTSADGVHFTVDFKGTLSIPGRD